MSTRTEGLLGAPFRVFFLLAALLAAFAVPLWLGALAHGWTIAPTLGARDWHVHEMLFGYLGAVIAGFLFTAIPNWTGRLPLAGRPLVLLALLWLAGRAAVALAPWPWLAGGAGAAFLPVVALLAWREVIAGRNWRNLPPCLLVTLLALAGMAFQVAELREIAIRAGLAVVALLIVLIGGRIVPSFTRNWLAKRGEERFPSSFGAFDKGVVLLSALALAAWTAMPEARPAGALLLLAGLANLLRLARWRGLRSLSEPLLAVLHLGYLWLAAALALLGGAVLWPQAIGPSQAMHALTAGAFGTMTLAVMTRASLGHGGRPLTAGGATVAIYLLVTLGALLRVMAPLLPVDYLTVVSAGGVLWSAAFALFAVSYGPLLADRARSSASG